MIAKTTKKEQSRRRILDSSARRIRERGISGTSVAEVMDGAGMTVGGFYAHFPSKDALVAETVTEAMRQARANLCAAAGDSRGAEWLRAAARSYLSRAHRDNPSPGCPLPATAGEIARADPPVRRALAAGIEEVAGEIATHEREAGRDESRAEALAALAMMVGGLTLARAIEGTPLSDELLKACRDHVDRCLGDK